MKRIKFGLAIVAICFASVQVQAQVKVKSAPNKIDQVVIPKTQCPVLQLIQQKQIEAWPIIIFFGIMEKVLVVK